MTKKIDSTTLDAVTELLENLGHDIKDVASIEIKSTGYIRILGTDRSLRTHRIVWPTFEEAK